MLERAIQIAAIAHAGQTDKGGSPYITHPLRVALSLQTLPEQIAAVLHDVVEDTSVTLTELAQEFPSEIVTAIDHLTKKSGETRIEAAHRATANPIARQVKISDVRDNMDISRIPNPSQKDFERLEQYRKVLQILRA